MKKIAAFAGLGLASASSFAAVPESVTSAVASIGADATTIATTVLVAVVTVFALKFIRKGL